MKNDYFETGRVNQKIATRDKILFSAQYFINKGLDFTLEDVAKKSEISRATIYRYYSKVEILANEAVLDISTQNPEQIIKSIEGSKLEEKLTGIQNYFNTLAINHENGFRKYLSTVLTSKSVEVKRGARRKKTLQLAFENSTINAEDEKKLIDLLTMLMGIEPLIVAKDVSGLNNEQSKEIMRWGMQLVLKSYFKTEVK